MTLLLKSVSENSPVTKLDVVSLVCLEGLLYHDYGSPKRALKGHCVCCSQKLRSLTLNLQCKLCGVKMHRYCELYRQSVTASYHRNGEFLSKVHSTAKQYFILQNLVCKYDNPEHQWAKLWIKQDHFCNICNQSKADFVCTACDLCVHDEHCLEKLELEQEKLEKLLENSSSSAFTVQEITTSNMELKHHFMRTVQLYISTRADVVTLFEQKLNGLPDRAEMQHGDVKGASESYYQLLYPFGGVASLKDFIGLTGAFGTVPGTGIVANIVTADTEKLQLLHVAPDMAVTRAERECKEHEENPCNKDCSWLPTALCCSQTKMASFRTACGESVIHSRIEETEHALGRNCEFCFRAIRRNGLQCLRCGFFIHAYCENFRLDKLRRDYPQEFFSHQLMKSNTLSSHPEPIKKPYTLCYSEERVSKRHSLNTISYNVEKMLTPKTCLVCRKLVFLSTKRTEKECEACKEVVHQKCEKFLTMKASGSGNSIKDEDRAYMVENLTTSSIEKENFNIQNETFLIRQQIQSLEKLLQQLELNRVTTNIESTERMSPTSSLNAKRTYEKPKTDQCIVPELQGLEDSSTSTQSRSHAYLCQITFNANTADAFENLKPPAAHEKCSALQESFDVQEATAKKHSESEKAELESLTMRPEYCEYRISSWVQDRGEETSEAAPRILSSVESDSENETLQPIHQDAIDTTLSVISGTFEKMTHNEEETRVDIKANGVQCASTEQSPEDISDGLENMSVLGAAIKIKERIVVWE